MKLISLFNHKGGVSKTTTTFNMGWMLAEQGFKTLIVDADPQCNLTALVLGYSTTDDFDTVYANNPNSDIYTCIKPVVDGSLGKVVPADPILTSNPNLSLLCGNIALSEIETQIGVALTTSAAIPAIRNIPGSIGAFLKETAIRHKFDYVLIDMSPSVGALNQCLLMSSDYFIVPTSPDFFCAQAIKSLAKVLPRWNLDIQSFRDNSIIYPFPACPPKFLGFISQKYRPRNNMPVKSFQKWIDIIKGEVKDTLLPALQPVNMSITAEEFMAGAKSAEPFNLSNIADFNSLIAQSQKHSTPVFALTDDQIEQSGVILETMKANRKDFRDNFSALANSVVQLAI
ncbi:TPA: ParA family protein [Citrobacter freundii]|nr:MULTISPECIES: AAA family ATPase [Citrobacter]QFX91381.1 AAA family ATPase [Citrobacter sp. S39]EJO6494659.1 ParA family protein [Citrobacter freundii]EKT8687671.1 ParA family protein [Citrobacter freundii]EKU7596921.1 ParA family protein [Citrobacter freundii]EKV6334455.1 ParA family protein [Citrobacter freundii]